MSHDTLLMFADVSRGVSITLCFVLIVQIVNFVFRYRASLMSHVQPFPAWTVYFLAFSFIALSLMEIYPHFKYFGHSPVLPNWIVSPIVFSLSNLSLAVLNSHPSLDLRKDE